MLRPQIRIVSPQQFPSHFPGETDVNAGIELSAGLGWIVYRSPSGPAVFKEGNDNGTNNFVLALPRSGSAIVMLSNSAMGYIPYDRGELRSPEARQEPIEPCSANETAR